MDPMTEVASIEFKLTRQLSDSFENAYYVVYPWFDDWIEPL